MFAYQVARGEQRVLRRRVMLHFGSGLANRHQPSKGLARKIHRACGLFLQAYGLGGSEFVINCQRITQYESLVQREGVPDAAIREQRERIEQFAGQGAARFDPHVLGQDGRTGLRIDDGVRASHPQCSASADREPCQPFVGRHAFFGRGAEGLVLMKRPVNFGGQRLERSANGGRDPIAEPAYGFGTRVTGGCHGGKASLGEAADARCGQRRGNKAPPGAHALEVDSQDERRRRRAEDMMTRPDRRATGVAALGKDVKRAGAHAPHRIGILNPERCGHRCRRHVLFDQFKQFRHEFTAGR